jgi:hypothetical protein
VLARGLAKILGESRAGIRFNPRRHHVDVELEDNGLFFFLKTYYITDADWT